MRREQVEAIGAGIAILAICGITLVSPIALGFVIGRWTT